jgi:ribosomal protein L37AE/L43A
MQIHGENSMNDIDRLQTTGEGSVWSKQQKNQKRCPKCNSTDLIYENKHYAKCISCGNRFIKRPKIMGKNMKLNLLDFNMKQE